MLSSSELFPVTVGVGLWGQVANSNNGGGPVLWSLLVVGSLGSVVPLLIAFLTLQKHWQSGLAAGSIK